MIDYSEIRKTDYNGHVTIPSRMLEGLGIKCGDEVRIIVTNDHIEMRPFEKDYAECSEKLTAALQEIQNLIEDIKIDILNIPYNK